MNRRETVFATLALGASPLVCLGQQAGRTYRLGLLTINARADWVHLDPYLVAFVQRLGEMGFVEGAQSRDRASRHGGQA